MVTLRESILSQMGMGERSTPIIKSTLPIMAFRTLAKWLVSSKSYKLSEIEVTEADFDKVFINLYHKLESKEAYEMWESSVMSTALKSNTDVFNRFLLRTGSTKTSYLSQKDATFCSITTEANKTDKPGRRGIMRIAMEGAFAKENTELIKKEFAELRKSGFKGKINNDILK